MKWTTHIIRCVAVSLAVISIGSLSLAGKPGGKPGGGGGGGPSYQILALDDANGTVLSNALDISNSGLVVGSVYDPVLDEWIASCWTIDDTEGVVTSSLQVLTGDGHTAHGVNDVGEIVGIAIQAPSEFGGTLVARYWQSKDATPLPLPPLAGDAHSIAEGISNDGIVCGLSFGRVGGGSSAVVWRVNIEVVDGEPTSVVWGPLELPTLVPATEGPDTNYGNAISDNDAEGFAVIAGDSGLAAVAWTVESLVDGTLAIGPSQILDVEGKGRGVNNSGAACGTSFSLSETGWEPVLWDSSVQTLDRAKFVLSAHARDINDSGVVVGEGGYSRKFVQGRRAVVWPSASASMVLLDKFLPKNSPFSHLESATAVNNSGLIVGRANNGAFLAVPN